MKFSFLLSICVAAVPLCSAQEPVVDNWDDALRSTTAIVTGTSAPAPEGARRQGGFVNKELALDFSDRKVGAFSLGARREAAANVVGFDFRAGVWGHQWNLPGTVQVQGWLHHPPGGALAVELQDGTGRSLAKAVAACDAPGEDGWQRFSAPLTLDGNGTAVAAVRVRFDAPVGEALRVDGVEFVADDRRIGVTDRSLDEWMAAEKETRSKRIEAARTAGAKSDFSGKDRQSFDQLWLGQDLEKNNADLREYYEKQIKGAKEGTTDLWALPENTRLIEAYYQLGSHGHFQPARLEPATEKMLLELLWFRTEHKNDIAIARQSTWWLTGSENHDLNTKVSCLLTSRIFMNEPEYRDRVYPDPGEGPGYGYWFHSASAGGHGQGPKPGGHFADGKPYRAKDHYEAWLVFFHQYINERVRHGFFLERASAGYMKWTLMFLQSAHAYCGDEALRDEIGKFLDLVWADWAQEQLAGIRGGPKTRHHHSVGGYDSMTDLARFFLGGPGSTNHLYSNQLSDDFTLPKVVWNIALDTQGRGSYNLLSQGIGEADPVSPRPPGLERTMLLRPDSRFVRVSHVTPDYILGTQMDDPDAVQSHLSAAGRWQGMICTQDPAARLVTISLPEKTGENVKAGGDDLEIMFRNVQSGSSLVTQQARRWYQISPQWFPSNPQYEKPVQIWVGKAWDEVIEQGAWTFVRKGSAYAAIRVLAAANTDRTEDGDKEADAGAPGKGSVRQMAEHPWHWSDDKKTMVLDDKFSPIIIEAGNQAEYGDLTHFQQAVAAATVELRETVVAGFYLVRYKGPAKDAHEILFNAATADTGYIDGKPCSYRLDEPYVSPFIHDKDGVVTIRKGADELSLKFTP